MPTIYDDEERDDDWFEEEEDDEVNFTVYVNPDHFLEPDEVPETDPR